MAYDPDFTPIKTSAKTAYDPDFKPINTPGKPLVNGSTSTRSFINRAGRGAIPGTAALVGAGRGAMLGAKAGLINPALAVPGAIVGGLGGGFLASGVASGLQEKVLERFPKFRGKLDAEMAEDVKEHPIASAAGGIAPMLIGMKPGLPRSVPQAALGAGLGAASEIVPAVTQGRPIDRTQLVASTLAGTFLNEPNRFGRKMGISSSPQKVKAKVSDITDLPPETQGRITKVTEALKAAQPVRAEQEALYTKERGERLAQVLAVRGKLGGEAGYQAELSQLKGELPKAKFESIRPSLTQQDIDGLFNDINQSKKIFAWESLNAKTGLTKLLGPEGGIVPTEGELDLLQKVFGEDFVKTALSKRSFLEKSGSELLEAGSLPRALMATGDMSAPLRQGAFLSPRHPVIAAKAFTGMVRQFFSPKYFQASQQEIASRPSYELMKKHKLALTDMGQSLSSREETFMSKIPEKIPVFRHVYKASNRAYVGFLNRMRADVFDSLLSYGKRLGVSEDPHFLDSTAQFVNSGTGRGSLRVPVFGGIKGNAELERAAPLLNSTLFSPRLMASRLNLLDSTFYVRLHPTVRKQAIESLFSFVGAGATVLGLLKMNGAKVGTDPRSSDFGKAKFGNTRYDLWAGFQPYIRTASQLISGKTISSTTGQERTLGEGYGATTRGDIVSRFVESKESPWLSFATDWLKGKDFTGRSFKPSVEVADRFIPMFAQDVFDVMREHGNDKFWMAIPAFFGSGVQTYGKQIPRLDKTESGKQTVKFRGEPSLGELAVNKVTGNKVTNIPERFHSNLSKAKAFQIQREIGISKAKKTVLETKRPVRVGNTLVYLQNGVVRTKSFGGESRITPENVLRRDIQNERK